MNMLQIMVLISWAMLMVCIGGHWLMMMWWRYKLRSISAVINGLLETISKSEIGKMLSRAAKGANEQSEKKGGEQ